MFVREVSVYTSLDLAPDKRREKLGMPGGQAEKQQRTKRDVGTSVAGLKMKFKSSASTRSINFVGADVVAISCHEEVDIRKSCS